MRKKFNRLCIVGAMSLVCVSATCSQAHAGVITGGYNANCSNLKVGEEYEFRVELVDKETGAQARNSDGSELTKSIKFIAKRNHAKVAVTFNVDDDINSGKTLLIKAGIYHDGKISQELSNGALPENQILIPEVAEENCKADTIEEKSQADVLDEKPLGGVSDAKDSYLKNPSTETSEKIDEATDNAGENESGVKNPASTDIKENSQLDDFWAEDGESESQKSHDNNESNNANESKKNEKSNKSQDSNESNNANESKKNKKSNKSRKSHKSKKSGSKTSSSESKIVIAEYAPSQAYLSSGAASSTNSNETQDESNEGKQEGNRETTHDKTEVANNLGAQDSGKQSSGASVGGNNATSNDGTQASDGQSEGISVKATAFNLATGTNKSKARSNVTLVDKLELKGLERGKKYIIRSMVINSRTGKQLCASAHGSREFTAKQSMQTESVGINFDATEWAGTQCCVVSDVYCNGKKIKHIASEGVERRISFGGGEEEQEEKSDNSTHSSDSNGEAGIVERAMCAFGKLVAVIIDLFDSGAIS